MTQETTFAGKFKSLLKKKGENQTDAAIRLGITPGYVSSLVRGAYRPSLELLERIIREYELPRGEWLSAAGYEDAAGKAVGGPVSEDLRAVIAETASRTAEQLEKVLWGLDDPLRKPELARLISAFAGTSSAAELSGRTGLSPAVCRDLLTGWPRGREAILGLADRLLLNQEQVEALLSAAGYEPWNARNALYGCLRDLAAAFSRPLEIDPGQVPLRVESLGPREVLHERGVWYRTLAGADPGVAITSRQAPSSILSAADVGIFGPRAPRPERTPRPSDEEPEVVPPGMSEVVDYVSRGDAFQRMVTRLTEGRSIEEVSHAIGWSEVCVKGILAGMIPPRRVLLDLLIGLDASTCDADEILGAAWDWGRNDPWDPVEALRLRIAALANEFCVSEPSKVLLLESVRESRLDTTGREMYSLSPAEVNRWLTAIREVLRTKPGARSRTEWSPFAGDAPDLSAEERAEEVWWQEVRQARRDGVSYQEFLIGKAWGMDAPGALGRLAVEAITGRVTRIPPVDFPNLPVAYEGGLEYLVSGLWHLALAHDLEWLPVRALELNPGLSLEEADSIIRMSEAELRQRERR